MAPDQGSCCLGVGELGVQEEGALGRAVLGVAGDGQNNVKIQLCFHEKKGTLCIVGPRETPFISDALAHKGLKKHSIQTSNGRHKRAALLSKKGLRSFSGRRIFQKSNSGH